MKRIRKKRRSAALGVVRKFFPQVTSVSDAKDTLLVTVTDKDVKASFKKKHAECAMAVACKREHKADGVIMAISTAYVIHGNHATRYVVPSSVGRELTSFDRGSNFAPGDYQLSRVPPMRELGVRKGARDNPRDKNLDGSRSRHLHMTEGIRAVLKET